MKPSMCRQGWNPRSERRLSIQAFSSSLFSQYQCLFFSFSQYNMTSKETAYSAKDLCKDRKPCCRDRHQYSFAIFGFYCHRLTNLCGVC